MQEVYSQSTYKDSPWKEENVVAWGGEGFRIQ